MRDPFGHRINIDFDIWGQKLDLENPPSWFNGAVDLGLPALYLPMVIDKTGEYSTRMWCQKQLHDSVAYHQFIPWAKVNLYEKDQEGDVPELKRYLLWLDGKYAEQGACFNDIWGVSVLMEEEAYQRHYFGAAAGPQPASGYNATPVYGGNGSGAGHGPNGNFYERSTVALSWSCGPNTTIKVATPASLLGVNPFTAQWRHPDRDGYSGVLRNQKHVPLTGPPSMS